jgi:hypothetical protein
MSTRGGSSTALCGAKPNGVPDHKCLSIRSRLAAEAPGHAASDRRLCALGRGAHGFSVVAHSVRTVSLAGNCLTGRVPLDRLR